MKIYRLILPNTNRVPELLAFTTHPRFDEFPSCDEITTKQLGPAARYLHNVLLLSDDRDSLLYSAQKVLLELDSDAPPLRESIYKARLALQELSSKLNLPTKIPSYKERGVPLTHFLDLLYNSLGSEIVYDSRLTKKYILQGLKSYSLSPKYPLNLLEEAVLENPQVLDTLLEALLQIPEDDKEVLLDARQRLGAAEEELRKAA